MNRRLWAMQSSLASVVMLLMSACGPLGGDNQGSKATTGQGNGIRLPFSVTALPDPGQLKATLDCPKGPVSMTISGNTASGSCTGIKPGTVSFTIHFSYGSNNVELASSTKTVNVVAGNNPELSFAATDYSFPDSDGDGYTNLYEISNEMEPNTANDLIIIAANDGVTGIEPYITDGTAAHTKLINDINPNTDSSPNYIIVVSGVMLADVSLLYGAMSL